MGENSALVGCLAQNLHAGTRQYLLGGLLEVFGMQLRGIWDALGSGLQLALLLRAKLVGFFLVTKYDSFLILCGRNALVKGLQSLAGRCCLSF